MLDKTCYKSCDHITGLIKQDLVTKRNHIMNNLFDFTTL